jgi:hypothetical protein
VSRIKHLGSSRGQERVVFETELEPPNVILSIKPGCCGRCKQYRYAARRDNGYKLITDAAKQYMPMDAMNLPSSIGVSSAT